MTDNSSTPGTQEPPLKKSRRTLSPEHKRKLIEGRTKKKDTLPFWQTVPRGMVRSKDRKGRTRYTQRKTRPTEAEIKAGKPVGKHYNLVFVQNDQRTARTYEVTFTSAIDPLKTFRVRVAASSLRQLFQNVVLEIGNLRATPTMENFSLHFLALSEKQGMAEEIINVPYAEELTGSKKPSTDEPVEPIVLED